MIFEKGIFISQGDINQRDANSVLIVVKDKGMDSFGN